MKQKVIFYLFLPSPAITQQEIETDKRDVKMNSWNFNIFGEKMLISSL